MPRPLLAAAAAATLVLTSCGDDNGGGAPAPAPRPPVSGRVLGQPFTAADASALVLGRATCDFEGTLASATGVVVGFGSFSGLCQVLTQNQGCGVKANATIVNAIVVRANVLPGGTATPVQPGTYAISSATPTPDGTGHVTVAQAVAQRTDAVCAMPGGTMSASSGTIRIDAVGTRVTGNVDLLFPDGGRVTGSFDAPACAFQTDVCTALGGFGCTSQTCMP